MENNTLNIPVAMESLINREIRPALQSHGGDLGEMRLCDDILYFRLVGACHGCPSAWLTAEEIVKAPLMANFPELKDVVADTNMDDDMIQLAKDVLSGKRKFS